MILVSRAVDCAIGGVQHQTMRQVLACLLLALSACSESIAVPAGEVFVSDHDMTHAEARDWCVAGGGELVTSSQWDATFDACDESGYGWCHIALETSAWPYYALTVEGSIITVDSQTLAPAACVR